MSYTENEEENKKQISKEDMKLENPLKVILTDTTVVTPQDIIDKDSDKERKEEFKKAEKIIETLYPEENPKKKRRKKEKEEYDKSLEVNREWQNAMSRQQRESRQQEQKDRGIERGE